MMCYIEIRLQSDFIGSCRQASSSIMINGVARSFRASIERDLAALN